MKFTIDYTDLAGQEKRDRAIEDMREYNPGAMNALGTVAMEAIYIGHLSFTAAFAGIQGYPVVALWDETRQIMKDMTT